MLWAFTPPPRRFCVIEFVGKNVNVYIIGEIKIKIAFVQMFFHPKSRPSHHKAEEMKWNNWCRFYLLKSHTLKLFLSFLLFWEYWGLGCVKGGSDFEKMLCGIPGRDNKHRTPSISGHGYLILRDILQVSFSCSCTASSRGL